MRINLFYFVLPIALISSCMFTDSQALQNSDSVSSSKVTRQSYIRDSACTVDSLGIVFYIPENCIAEITNMRPLKSDSSIVLVCAAAFTRLENDAIDGLYVIRGNVMNRKVNRGLGGGITIPSSGDVSSCIIAGTEMGSKLDSAFIEKIISDSVSFFQQIQLNRDGLPLVFRKDVSLFQRRAICILHGQAVIAESRNVCTLQQFADALDAAGVDNSIYLDMGSWDEGWFRRKNNEIQTIGLIRTATKRQSNWLVYRSKS
ncbi:MAG: hypothetical protein RL007_2658 [Bacteroidota bacterium]|jgi:hypothetical protein